MQPVWVERRSFPLLPWSSSEERRNIQAFVLHHRQGFDCTLYNVGSWTPFEHFPSTNTSTRASNSNRVLNAVFVEHKWLGEPSVSHKTAIRRRNQDWLSLSLSLSLFIRSLALLLSSLSFSSWYCDELSLKKKKKKKKRSKHHLNILEAMYIHVLTPVLCKQKSFVANLTLFKHAHSTH